MNAPSASALKRLGIACILISLITNLWLFNFPSERGFSMYDFSGPEQQKLKEQKKIEEGFLAVFTAWVLPVLLFGAAATVGLVKAKTGTPPSKAVRFFILSSLLAYFPLLGFLHPYMQGHPQEMLVIIMGAPLLFPLCLAIYLWMLGRHFNIRARAKRLWGYAGIMALAAFAGLCAVFTNILGTAILAEIVVWQSLTLIFLLKILSADAKMTMDRPEATII